MANIDHSATLAAAVAEVIRPVLRAKVGMRSGQMSPEQLRDLTGIGASRLKALKEAGRAQPPTLEQFLLLAEIFGAPIVNPVLSLVGWEGQPRGDGGHTETNPFQALRALSKRMDAMTERLEDGIFTPSEKMASARDLEALADELRAFVSGWKAELGQ